MRGFGAFGVIPLGDYALSQTFNSSGTYTVPAGKRQVAVLMCGGGGSGNVSGYSKGGGGGGGGGLLAFKDYDVTAGSTFTVTVGGSGGTSNFGNIAGVNGGGNGSYASGGGGGSANAGPTGYNFVAGASGGNGGNSTYSGTAQSGNAGGSSNSISLSLTGLGTVNLSSGGGGGGGGGGSSTTVKEDSDSKKSAKEVAEAIVDLTPKFPGSVAEWRAKESGDVISLPGITADSTFDPAKFRAKEEGITIVVEAPSIIDEEGFKRAVVDALNESANRGTGGGGGLKGTAQVL